MQDEIEELAQYLVDKLGRFSKDLDPHRLLVGIAGVPASGKSTFSELLTQRVNASLRCRELLTENVENRVSSPDGEDRDQAILVGLDGWHLSRAQLDVLPDPKLAHDRRGIHWTFDGAGYVAFLRKLRDTSLTGVITAPSFDHALKDPTPDNLSIYPYHKIVIIEGLYVFLAIPPWSEGGLLLDERWFIEVDPDQARKRLVGRHVLTGVAKDIEEAEWRADENDIPNGRFIIANILEPTRLIKSIEIPNFQD